MSNARQKRPHCSPHDLPRSASSYPGQPQAWQLPALALLFLSLLAFPSVAASETRSSADARSAYEEGRRLWQSRTADNLRASVPLFESALDIDPEMADAWAGLADSLALLGLYSLEPPAETMPRAREAAERALELAPRLAHAHASLGLVRYLYDWDFAAAEESFRRALELDPENTAARHWFAMMLTVVGRFEEAITHIDHAQALQPESRLLCVKAATIYTSAGQFARARAQLERCGERYPDYALADRERGFLLLKQGQIEAARTALEAAAQKSSGAKSNAALAYVYGRLGDPDKARQILGELEAIAQSEFVPPLSLALIHAGLGDREKSLEQIERALEIHDPGLVYLRTKPGLEAVVDEPRFRAVAAAVGLAPSQ